MRDIDGILHSLSAMPYWAVGATVVISGFVLAGYAIYAVSTIARGRK